VIQRTPPKLMWASGPARVLLHNQYDTCAPPCLGPPSCFPYEVVVGKARSWRGTLDEAIAAARKVLPTT